MFPLTRIIIAIITTAATIVGVTNPATDTEPPAEPTTSTITLHGADSRWTETINDNLDRFAQADLDAPTVEIHIWDATDAPQCRDSAGYFTNPDTGPRVDLCIDYIDTKLGTQLRQKLVLHELAHAWILINVTDTARTEFMALRDIDTWNDPTAYHPARGTEIAARTLVSTLQPDRPHDNDDLCGYELLTNQNIPDDRNDPCTGPEI